MSTTDCSKCPGCVPQQPQPTPQPTPTLNIPLGCSPLQIDGNKLYSRDGSLFTQDIYCQDDNGNQISCFTTPIYQQNGGLTFNNTGNQPALYCAYGQTGFSGESYLACNTSGNMNDNVTNVFYTDSTDCLNGNTMMRGN